MVLNYFDLIFILNILMNLKGYFFIKSLAIINCVKLKFTFAFQNSILIILIKK